MALASNTALNAALDGLSGDASTDVIPYVSLHTATTSTTGAAEYSGVTRQACSWNAASGGSKTNSSSLSFTTDGLTEVTHIGTWSAVSAGTFAMGAALTSGVTAVNITIAAGAITLSAT